MADETRVDWDRWSSDIKRIDPRVENSNDFWRLGAADAEMILADVVADLPGTSAALEIGCGWGRLLRPMAARFGEVWGVDFSAPSLARAASLLADLDNVHVRQNDGRTLAPLPTDHFDFCFSFFLFDCLPTVEVVRSYFAEVHRVLRPGGIVKAQVAGVYARNPFRDVYRETAGPWEGVRFTLSEATRLLEDAGFELMRAHHASTPQELAAKPEDDPSLARQYRLWVVARKGTHVDSFERVYWELGQALGRVVPAGAGVITPEPGMDLHLTAAGAGAVRLLPLFAADTEAGTLEALQARRAEGGDFLFLTHWSQWWLPFYPALARMLETDARAVARGDGFVVYAFNSNERG